MSLKAFHLFFICISILLTAYFGGWCFQNGETLLGSASLFSLVCLSVYLGWFLRKSKGMGYLVFFLPFFICDHLIACNACLSNTKSPLIQATNNGVLFLMGAIGILLFGFAGLFVFWRYREIKLRLKVLG